MTAVRKALLLGMLSLMLGGAAVADKGVGVSSEDRAAGSDCRNCHLSQGRSLSRRASIGAQDDSSTLDASRVADEDHRRAATSCCR